MSPAESVILAQLNTRALSKAFAAAYLGKSKSQIDRLCAARKLAYVQQPGRRVFRLVDLDAYQTARLVPAKDNDDNEEYGSQGAL